MASLQQGDLGLSGPPQDQGAGGPGVVIRYCDPQPTQVFNTLGFGVAVTPPYQLPVQRKEDLWDDHRSQHE
ncbi:hypothetical protein PoB_001154000 [Plakobranchus ocellatus]|uniref:Uncharacterized protein n=1 Tax=Plakobranchus ocellatus TaxID=259542 RepID=A0AAV3YQM3_9GAST|nr:hypothetical protein PoB_001154000 [Plakobranchus ocellatus]